MVATLLRCILSLQSIDSINTSTIWAIRETVRFTLPRTGILQSQLTHYSSSLSFPSTLPVSSPSSVALCGWVRHGRPLTRVAAWAATACRSLESPSRVNWRVRRRTFDTGTAMNMRSTTVHMLMTSAEGRVLPKKSSDDGKMQFRSPRCMRCGATIWTLVGDGVVHPASCCYLYPLYFNCISLIQTIGR
jgi:hypothetical protein